MAEGKGAKRIGVLGGGNVGGALARLSAGKGHTVSIGVPDPNRTQAKGGSPGAGVRLTTNREAAAGAEIVALAVPWPAAQEAIRAAGDLAGKVVIDCTNPLSPDMKSLVIGTTTSAAEQVAQWAAESAGGKGLQGEYSRSGWLITTRAAHTRAWGRG